MKYLCLVRQSDPRLSALDPSARRTLDEEIGEYVERLRRAGHLLAGALLEPASAGVLVRARGGHATVSGAPSEPAAESPAGFLLLDARDLNEAIQLVARSPAARFGTIEIRPVRVLLGVQ
jgi:hypothetical protein